MFAFLLLLVFFVKVSFCCFRFRLLRLIFSEVQVCEGRVIGQAEVIKVAASSSCLLLQASKDGKVDEKEEEEDQTVI